MRYIALVMTENHQEDDIIKNNGRLFLTSKECERWAKAIIKASEFAETHDVEKINKIANEHQMNSDFDIDAEAVKYRKN